MLYTALTRLVRQRPILWILTDGNHINWDAVLARLNSYPSEARWICWSETTRNTFLHRILSKRSSNFPPLEVVIKTIEVFPKALKTSNAYGRLPLHEFIIAFGDLTINLSSNQNLALLYLLKSNPKGTQVKSSRKNLPLHYALQVHYVQATEARHRSLVRMLERDTHVLLRLTERLLTAKNVEQIDILLRVNPVSVFEPLSTRSKSFSNTLEFVAFLWKHLMVIDLDLYPNLCRLSDSVIWASYVSRFGRDMSNYCPIHSLITLKSKPLEIALFREYALNRYRTEILRRDRRGRFCLHLALKHQMTWNTGVKVIFQANSKAIDQKDIIQKLYPFMLAAVGEKADLDTIYELLRAAPTLCPGPNANIV